MVFLQNSWKYLVWKLIGLKIVFLLKNLQIEIFEKSSQLF